MNVAKKKIYKLYKLTLSRTGKCSNNWVVIRVNLLFPVFPPHYNPQQKNTSVLLIRFVAFWLFNCFFFCCLLVLLTILLFLANDLTHLLHSRSSINFFSLLYRKQLITFQSDIKLLKRAEEIEFIAA
mgnify:CR=1 FL=1